MKMRVDQGSAFTSVRWTIRAKAVGTDVQQSVLETHNSLGPGERYNTPLRRIFLKIRGKHPKMRKIIILNLAVKDLNDTMLPEGLVPSYLVFGCIPRFPSTESTMPTQQQRVDAMQSARREMAIVTAELRIRKALSSHVPRNADLVVEVGDLVRVFRETGKRYVGPYPVILVDVNHVFINENYLKVKFNKHQVLPATTYGRIMSVEHLVPSLHSSLPKLSPNRPCKSSIVNPKENSRVLITEVLHHNDPRLLSELADRARKQEIETFVRRGT